MATDASQSFADQSEQPLAARVRRGGPMLDTTRRVFIGATVVTLLASCAGSGARPLSTQGGKALLLENGDRLVVS